ncbi:MAG: K+dependent Na+ exchanger related-protein [candidate division TM6 bacterium GW2011_GWF2_38_10]|nr:MAG: K+dependent Na+ exchanger related-protein [candidate division TM6 bacterium GW2011_GWF2_38_10]
MVLLGYSILLVLGLFLLWWAGDKAIASSQAIAVVYGVDTFLVGFVLLAVSTALPEFAIAFNAILKDVPALSVGDIIGSNFYNITAVLGFPIALVGPLLIMPHEIKNALIMVVINCVLMGFLFTIRVITPLMGVGLIVVYVGTIIFVWLTQRALQVEGVVNGEVEALTHPKVGALWLFIRFFFSIAGILVASHMCVKAALVIVAATPLTVGVMGSTIIALGTSLPELALSILSIKKKEYQLALGNALGAVLKQATLVLGFLAVFSRSEVSLSRVIWIAPFFFAAMAIITGGIVFRHKIGRVEGVALILLVAIFMLFGYTRLG